MRNFSIAWLLEAITEKDDILDYLAERSILAALALDEHIERQVRQLVEFPELGRKGRITDSFELVITSTPYLIAYRIEGDQVQILHVFHERREWPLKK